MGILNMNEHRRCHNYDISEHPSVEMVRIAAGTEVDLCVNYSEIVFFMEGRLRYTFRDYPEQERVKGQMLFLPAGGGGSYSALSNTTVIIFRLTDNIRLCDNFPIERLYDMGKNTEPHKEHKPQNTFAALEINPRLWHFLDGVRDCLIDGIRCKSYFDLKIKEFFALLRLYYSKEQIHDFIYLILSPDTAFSEYVRLHWHKFKTAEELAASMNLSYRQFSSKFKYVFGTTPRQWMMAGKAQVIYQELITTNKAFKQLAMENRFSTVGHFARFCKKELGNTPTGIRSGKKITGRTEMVQKK